MKKDFPTSRNASKISSTFTFHKHQTKQKNYTRNVINYTDIGTQDAQVNQISWKKIYIIFGGF